MGAVARLDAKERATLPSGAFAYVDARGRRRLPIHDEPHVRNALARFNQVTFDDDDARERSRRRLLNAAKKFGIVPVGFIDNQLRSERQLGQTDQAARAVLPTGFVTLLLSDIESSSGLLERLGDDYATLIEEVRSILVEATLDVGGQVVEARADEFFAVFESPVAGLVAAVTTQRAMRSRQFVGDQEVRVRLGLHSGYPTRAVDNYIGMAVHTAARVSAAAHGGQILVTGHTREATTGTALPDIRLRHLGRYRLRGIPDVTSLFQVAAPGLATRFPPPRTPPAPNVSDGA